MTPKNARKVYDRLMSYKNKKGEKLTKMKMNRLKDNKRVFTHKPHINENDGNGRTRDLVRRMDEILDQRQQKLREKRMENVRKKEKEIQKNCTFTPDINKNRKYG